ncbi:MAG: chromate efflux transporter [Gemmatimonadetes bacterium]|nr:chromate efflux transporter [Gemmatimonadota bacterium]NNM05915.1 chromate efflux transporter [Gemmatimonadota bacterium]
MKNTESRPSGYWDLARTFLRISLLGFGGPNAHLALMLDDVVDRQGWITREHFLHLVAATNLLPGPNSSEVAIHIGYTQRGWRGAFTTGIAFLLPTLVLVTLFSALYFRFGTLPAVEGLFWGLKPAILAVILAAGWKLGKASLGFPENLSPLLGALAVGGLLASFFYDRLEVPAMVVGGLITWALFRSRPGGGSSERSVPRGSRPESRPDHPESRGEHPDGGMKLSSWIPPIAAPVAVVSGLLPAAGSLGHLFLFMCGAGAVLFGGGYMLVALLEPFVVGSFGWVTADQFLDGIALTQAVPGPIVTLVAFVGFAVAGVPGAVVATVGIYLPSFAAVLLVAPHLERWRQLDGFRAALKGVNAVVAGAILGVGLTLLPSGLPDYWAAGIFLLALVGLVRFKAPAVWIVAGGLVLGGVRLALIG